MHRILCCSSGYARKSTKAVLAQLDTGMAAYDYYQVLS
jgi:hypothetical protein